MAQARAVPRRGVNIFEEGKPMWQILLVFLVPLMLSNVLQSASQTMASIWIGRLISTQALGAISAVFPDRLPACSRSCSASRAAAAC